MVCSVTYWTAILAYIFITEMKISQFTKEHSKTVLFCELRIVNRKNMKIFFSLCLTQAEKVKAYLQRGARRILGYGKWPNEELGYGHFALEIRCQYKTLGRGKCFNIKKKDFHGR